MSRDILPFPLSAFPTAAEMSLLEVNSFPSVCSGFVGNLPADLRHTFVREVCKWAGESFSCSNNPLNLQLSDGQLARFDEGIGRTNVTFEAVSDLSFFPFWCRQCCVLQNVDFLKT